MSKYLIYSILWLIASIIGGVVSFFDYMNASRHGGSYTVWYGIVLIGFASFVQNLLRHNKYAKVHSKLPEANAYITEQRDEELNDPDLKSLVGFRAFTALFAYSILFDNVIKGNEKDIYVELLDSMDIEPEIKAQMLIDLENDLNSASLNEDYILSQIQNHFSKSEKVSLKLVAIILSVLANDNNLSEKELSFVQRLGKSLGLAEDDVNIEIEEAKKELNTDAD